MPKKLILFSISNFSFVIILSYTGSTLSAEKITFYFLSMLDPFKLMETIFFNFNCTRFCVKAKFSKEWIFPSYQSN